MKKFLENVNLVLSCIIPSLSLTGFLHSSPVSDAGEVAPFGRYGCDEDDDASPSQVAESDSLQLLDKDRRHRARSWILKPTCGDPLLTDHTYVPDFVKIYLNRLNFGKFRTNSAIILSILTEYRPNLTKFR